MEKVLQLVFKKADGKQKVLNVTDPRENVTAEEARTAMQSIVDSGVFNADGNALAEVVEARVRTTEGTYLQPAGKFRVSGNAFVVFINTHGKQAG